MFRRIIPTLTVLAAITPRPAIAQETVPLVTGKQITPVGKHVDVGSFPANGILSPDGRFFVVTNAGYREFLTVISTTTGEKVSQIASNDTNKTTRKKESLYYGLVFGPKKDETATLYVSRGFEDRISIFKLDANGILTDTGEAINNPSPVRTVNHVAGIALSGNGTTLYAANNLTTPETGLKGSLSIIDIPTNKITARVELPGFPYAVAALTEGANAGKRVYITSERDGVVSVVDPSTASVVKTLKTGSQPISLLFNKAQSSLFVANAGSDTVSMVDTGTDSIKRTILLRPDNIRGLPGATPMCLSLSPDEKTLYVALADMNAVAVVDVPAGKLRGYIPTGWYPTAVTVTPDGRNMLVANAKGVNLRNPNDEPVGNWGQYIENIIEGTVSWSEVPSPNELTKLTAQTVVNNKIPERGSLAVPPLKNPGIEHVIYIVKENRTYDQVLGDVKTGNGDSTLTMFGRNVTPNQHALAERFVLLDNFHACAEVSADGWCWSTSGMASEYTERNSTHSYSGRGRSYDFEGTNNGVPVDLFNLPDVAEAPGGYIWDLALKKGLEIRNYGFHVSDYGPFKVKGSDKAFEQENTPAKKSLIKVTNNSFRQFDMSYADSDAWVEYNSPAPKQTKTYGANKATSRFAEWKRDFDAYVEKGKLPRFMTIRMPRDHTAGTTAGLSSPRAMVADNDYAVGKIVEAVSNSPFWKKTAIFILEDDAQNGYDHVDAHRSTCYVVSPFVKRATVDSKFHNTDSVLRTMEIILGLPPMCQYDAVATPFDIFGESPDNAEPFTAILPERSVVCEVNTRSAYKARESAKLSLYKEESGPDEALNEILWHSIMGSNKPLPPVRYSLHLGSSKPTSASDDDD